MADPNEKPTERDQDFEKRISEQAKRRLKAKRSAGSGLWFGLGMMGLIGWSVVVPTLVGAALGGWIDHAYPGSRSWTLALLIAGLLLGCWNAWRWVSDQNKAIGKESNNDDE